MRPKLNRLPLGELADGPLSRGVHRHFGQGIARGQRADVDDLAALTALDHLAADLLAEEVQALEIDGHDLVVVFLRDLDDGLADVHAGVVEEDVYGAALRQGRVHARQIGHVQLDRAGLAASGLNGGDGFVELTAGAGGADDRGTGRRHACGHAAANAATRAGDEGNFSR